ncbi:hypothetical protein Chls_339 [Chlamydia suis]|uniref:Uncharacterized protein n=1 Tax=Chlamydia suis TaxID=83559 RepID=A0ABX6IQ37_9CHLA|nr:hypothetical protein Chls_339 [Chlamydia suis]
MQGVLPEPLYHQRRLYTRTDFFVNTSILYRVLRKMTKKNIL